MGPEFFLLIMLVVYLIAVCLDFDNQSKTEAFDWIVEEPSVEESDSSSRA